MENKELINKLEQLIELLYKSGQNTKKQVQIELKQLVKKLEFKDLKREDVINLTDEELVEIMKDNQRVSKEITILTNIYNWRQATIYNEIIDRRIELTKKENYNAYLNYINGTRDYSNRDSQLEQLEAIKKAEKEGYILKYNGEKY